MLREKEIEQLTANLLAAATAAAKDPEFKATIHKAKAAEKSAEDIVIESLARHLAKARAEHRDFRGSAKNEGKS
jgi:hypothetical protein